MHEAFNRTIPELKFYKRAFDYYENRGLQSHHTGIEMNYTNRDMLALPFLQSHHTGIEISLISFIRCPSGVLQSHHTGIEIRIRWLIFLLLYSLQSHHTGIEIITLARRLEKNDWPSIAPYRN